MGSRAKPHKGSRFPAYPPDHVLVETRATGAACKRGNRVGGRTARFTARPSAREIGGHPFEVRFTPSRGWIMGEPTSPRASGDTTLRVDLEVAKPQDRHGRCGHLKTSCPVGTSRWKASWSEVVLAC